MRKLFFLILLFGTALSVQADESWLGVYMQGNKIGYSFSSLTNTTLNKAPAKKSEGRTVMHISEEGQALSLKINSTSWTDDKGNPILMEFLMSSAGRTQKVDAAFSKSSILIKMDVSGAESHKVLSIPQDAPVVDDAVSTVLEKGYKVGKVAYFYVLEPMTASLVKTKVTMDGSSTTTVNGKKVTANKIEISDPQETSFVYFTAKGDLVKVEAPMGIEMYPESREEALKEDPGGARAASSDIAYSTSLTPDKAILNVGEVKDLRLRITGHDLSALPSDAHQTVTKSGNSWIVDVHPVGFAGSPDSISQAHKEQPSWTMPSQDIPSGTSTFQELATKLTSGCKTVPQAAKKIHDFVFSSMTPNAGIGVLRDASEILKTKEGVCRDYAVLTATLLRAARVPSKLVSGLVYEEGSFFYHAWVEVWDGKNWIGVDSTLPDGKLTAGHIQLAEGNVDDAFTFTFLDRAKVEVLNVRRV